MILYLVVVFFGVAWFLPKSYQVFVSQKNIFPGVSQDLLLKNTRKQWPPSCLSTPGAVKAQNQQIFVALPKIRFEATRCQMPTRVATHYHLEMFVLQTEKDKNATKKQIHQVMRFWGGPASEWKMWNHEMEEIFFDHVHHPLHSPPVCEASILQWSGTEQVSWNPNKKSQKNIFTNIDVC